MSRGEIIATIYAINADVIADGLPAYLPDLSKPTEELFALVADFLEEYEGRHCHD